MDRENRRNSILKPVWNQGIPSSTAVEFDEDLTESLSSRRKSLKKRVSFAGRDEIKEFRKHEALTKEENVISVEKYQQDCITQAFHKESVNSGKENCLPHALNISSVLGDNNFVAGAFHQASVLTLNQPQNSDHLANEDYVEMDVCKASPVKIIEEPNNCSHVGTITSEFQDITSCNLEIESNVTLTQVISGSKVDEEFHTTSSSDSHDFESGNLLPAQNFIENETGEFYRAAKTLNWNIDKFVENELILSKTENYITLKFMLDSDFLYDNVKHYTIEDIEVETKKAIYAEDKWARLGYLLLENTIEENNLSKTCSTTQDLPKFLYAVDEHIRIFLKFISEDSCKFEALVNPRSIRLSVDYSQLTFELSNLENLFWIRITLKLNLIFPLMAEEVTIENVLKDSFKRADELHNMILTIRPNGLYLTHVAECINDFLKFRPSIYDKRMLDLTTDKPLKVHTTA